MHKSFWSVYPWNTATLKQQKIEITFMNISGISGDGTEGLQSSPISMESLKMLSVFCKRITLDRNNDLLKL